MILASLDLNCDFPFLVGSASHLVYDLRNGCAMDHSRCTALHCFDELEQPVPQSLSGDPGDCQDQPRIAVVVTTLNYKTN